MKIKLRPDFLALLAALALTNGCETLHKFIGQDQAENYLQTQENGHLAEDKSGDDLDPLQRHLRARQQVDPNNFQKTAQYTTHGMPAENIHERVLRLDGASEEEEPLSASAEPVQTAPAPIFPQEIQKKETMPPLQSGQVSVIGVRVGEHPGKTRIVLDLGGPASFNYRLDNNSRRLSVTLPGTGWNAPLPVISGAHPLIEAYHTQSAPAGGTVLEIQLKKPVTIFMTGAYKPDQGRGHRIVLDIAPL